MLPMFKYLELSIFFKTPSIKFVEQEHTYPYDFNQQKQKKGKNCSMIRNVYYKYHIMISKQTIAYR